MTTNLRKVSNMQLTDSQRERMAVIDYLQRVNVEGMKKVLSFSLQFVSLYDKNNKQYKISRTASLTYAKLVVEKITKVNNTK